MRAAIRSLAVLVALAPATAAAQMPGAPVLQNAFANRGLTVAGNYATGQTTSLAAVALAFSPGTGRFQFSGGLGQLDNDEGETMNAWGARVGVPVLSFATGRGGLSVFAGAGGASEGDVRILQVPVGVGAGWRMGLGATRALSVYGTAGYHFLRSDLGGVDDESESEGVVRFAVAGDVTLISKLGLTLGYEMGSESDQLAGGPRGSVFGVGLSWAFR